jgi:hypothetical protein
VLLLRTPSQKGRKRKKKGRERRVEREGKGRNKKDRRVVFLDLILDFFPFLLFTVV